MIEFFFGIVAVVALLSIHYLMMEFMPSLFFTKYCFLFEIFFFFEIISFQFKIIYDLMSHVCFIFMTGKGYEPVARKTRRPWLRGYETMLRKQEGKTKYRSEKYVGILPHMPFNLYFQFCLRNCNFLKFHFDFFTFGIDMLWIHMSSVISIYGLCQ